MDFLYRNNVKLYRSATEGNILVKLMNINFTPTNELGRLTYSFTATAVEIDEYSINTLDKYNIQPFGKETKNESYLDTIQGQVVRPDPNITNLEDTSERQWFYDDGTNLIETLIKKQFSKKAK
jgi:hypothetical protein